MSPRPISTAPAPLNVAASLAGLEGLVLFLLAGVEVASYDSRRAVMNVSTSIGFVVFGVAIMACAWSLHRGRSWARAPIVLAQLILLGLAWSFRGEPMAAVSLLIVAALALAGTLHPASIDYLDGNDQR